MQGGYGLPFLIVGRPVEDGPFHGGASWSTVSPGYFEVFKIPVRRGRTFSAMDSGAATPAVIINETLARRYWKDGGDPLGSQLLIGKGVMREFDLEQPRQIIGVVADNHDAGLNDPVGPKVYVPQAQVPDAVNELNLRITPMTWAIRTTAAPYAVSSAVQEQLRQTTGLPVSDIRTMDEIVSRSTSRHRFNMVLMTIFGGAALALALIGIYGLMTYSVQQRTREIGIRMALGAEPAAVKRLIMLNGMVLVLAGVAIGITGAFWLTRFLAAFLFGVQARDPMAFVAVPLVLGAAALLALWLPARHASRVDPAIALRYE
jgi:predicted permease